MFCCARLSRFLVTLCLLGICGSRTCRAQDLVELVKKVEHAVVRVDAGDSFGSGVIVDERGFVFTNYHVIDGATSITVTLRSGETAKAQGYLAVDQSRDLALIIVDKLPKAATLPIASSAPQVGEKVAAFGNPKGFSFTTSEGIVSGVRTGAELRHILGDDAFRYLGYAENTTWVQTTAAISGGNSGGPLVSMKGEVVGLNTWTRNDGQSLNFAISCADMRSILSRTSGATVLNFGSLPRRKRTATRSRNGERPGFLEIDLPTGRSFSMAAFDYDPLNLLRQALEGRSSQVVIRHPNGAIYAAASHKSGQLHGIAYGTYENKQLMIFGTFADGKRQGVIQTFDSAGRPEYFAQYAKGKRQGFACLFDDGVLCLLADYKYDEPVYIQLMQHDRALEGFTSRDDADKDEKVRKRLEEMDSAESKLKANELVFRKQVAAYEAVQRKARAAALSPQKRDRTQARENARAAEEDAFLREMTRRAWQK